MYKHDYVMRDGNILQLAMDRQVPLLEAVIFTAEISISNEKFLSRASEVEEIENQTR